MKINMGHKSKGGTDSKFLTSSVKDIVCSSFRDEKRGLG